MAFELCKKHIRKYYNWPYTYIIIISNQMSVQYKFQKTIFSFNNTMGDYMKRAR